MVSKHNDDVLYSHTTLPASDGWAKYHQAHELLELSEWSQVLGLLAQAETLFRSSSDERGLWRALIGQALLHRREGLLDLAEARCMAALQVAEAADDAFAVGYVAWQLANLKVEQAQYVSASDYLDQAQLALDAVGLAPAGGLIAAAAQLCHEIGRWDQMQERGQIGVREAEAAIGAIQADLTARLRLAASAMQVLTAHSEAAERRSNMLIAAPPPIILPPAELPSLPWIGLSAWLGRLWRRLIHGSETEVADRLMRAPSARRPAREELADQALRPAPELPHTYSEGTAHLTPATSAELPKASDTEPTRAVAQPEPPKPPQPERVAPKSMSAPIVDRASLPLTGPQDGPLLAVQMLGPFRVTLNRCDVESWPSGRGRAVFKYILAHRDRPVARDTLMAIFWPDATPESARNSLNVALHGLRQALRAIADMPVVLFQNGAYRLNPELQIWLDVEEFKRCSHSGRRSEDGGDQAGATAKYEQAAALYQGDFMADDLADDWPVLMRERLRVDYLDTLDRLSHISFCAEQYAACATLCQLILAQDSCREDVHCRLMRCYSRQNQYHLALRQYQTCVEELSRELGVAPAAATSELYERIRQREHV